MKCVNCGNETLRPVCAVCVRELMDEAVRERIPLVGNSKPESRRIGFVAQRDEKARR